MHLTTAGETVIISLASLIFLMGMTLIGVVWRTGRQTGQTLAQVKRQGDDIRSLTESLDTHLRWHMGENPPPKRGRRAENKYGN